MCLNQRPSTGVVWDGGKPARGGPGAEPAALLTCPQTRRRRVPLPHQTDMVGAEMHYSLHGDVTFLGACHNVQVCEIGWWSFSEASHSHQMQLEKTPLVVAWTIPSLICPCDPSLAHVQYLPGRHDYNPSARKWSETWLGKMKKENTRQPLDKLQNTTRLGIFK